MAAKSKKTKSSTQPSSELAGSPAMAALLESAPEANPPPNYHAGSTRPFLVTTPDPSTTNARSTSPSEWPLMAFLFLVSVTLRFAHIASPDSVVFDEVHIGTYVGNYLKRVFFLDVHPPLTKMIYAVIAAVRNYDGNFSFAKVGTSYPDSVPYVAMRAFPAACGVATIMLAYLTLRASGVRPLVAAASASLLLVENANATVSKYMLVDSPVVFFIAAAVYSWKRFEVLQPFSRCWTIALLGTGVFLGAAVSSKWVGVCAMVWTILASFGHIWLLTGDLTVKPRTVIAHAFARVFGVVVVPITVYLAVFAVHLKVLDVQGPNSHLFTPQFRAHLAGNDVPSNIPATIGLGSTVSIRHLNSNGGYMHSHEHLYPAGSKQQQVSLYTGRDSNNLWRIEHYMDPMPTEFTPLTHGTKVRLVHVNTGRRIHSHDEKPPVSERDWQKEVSCYGFPGFEGDANDDFEVHIFGQRVSHVANDSKTVYALSTTVRFRHAMTGNWLFSTPHTRLPEFGFGNQEVTCAGQGADNLLDFVFEENFHPQIEDSNTTYVSYPRMSILSRIVESHKVMLMLDKKLRDFHPFQTDPTFWPMLTRGVNFWIGNRKQVYLIGNPVVWWLVTLLVPVFAIHVVVSVLRWHFGQAVATDGNVFTFNVQAMSYIAGWAAHYTPFGMVGRMFFIQHYLPALYFGVLAAGHFMEVVVAYVLALRAATTTVKKGKGTQVLLKQLLGMGSIGAVVVAAALFHKQTLPLIYGGQWTQSQCQKSKILSSWDFACELFPDSRAGYTDPTPVSFQFEPAKVLDISVPDPTVTAFNEAEQAERIARMNEQADRYRAQKAKEAEEQAIREAEEEAKEEAEEAAAKAASEAAVAAGEEVPESSSSSMFRYADLEGDEQMDIGKSIVDGIKNAAAAAGQIVNVTDPFAEPVKAVDPLVGESTDPVDEAVVKPMSEDLTDAMRKAKEAADSGLGKAQDAADEARKAAEPVVEKAKDVAGDAAEAAKPIIEKVQDAGNIVAEAAKPAVEKAKQVAQDAAEAAEPVVDKAKKAAGQAAEAAKPHVESAAKAAEPVVEKAKQVADDVAGAAEPVVEKAKEAVKDAAEAANL